MLATGPFGEIDSVVDLDRSSGIPDVISTVAIGIATAGAGECQTRRWQRASAVLLAACLGVITFDDAVGVDKDFTAFATLAEPASQSS